MENTGCVRWLKLYANHTYCDPPMAKKPAIQADKAELNANKSINSEKTPSLLAVPG